MMVVVAILAILAAVALPAYRNYAERSRLAEVLIEYDAMRVQSNVAAAEAGRDLCNWKIVWTGKNPDPQTAAIQAIVEKRLAAIDPVRWKPSVNHFTSLVGQGAPAPLTVQFGGIGAPAVARVHMLAAEFQRLGVFNKWDRDHAAVASFTAFLGTCSAGVAQSSAIGSTVSTSSHLVKTPSCSPTQQLSPDRSSCVAKTCGSGLALDPTSGACNPGCKSGEFEPAFKQDRGTAYQAFTQPASGPHTCFSATTQSCPADRPIPSLKDGALVCEAFDSRSVGAGVGPKPTACDSIPNSNPFLEISLAQKLSYKAHDCGGQPGDLCEIMAGPAGALTCRAGSFPYLKLVNDAASGTRTFERGCMSAAACQADWWQQSSQTEACTRFEPGKTYTQDFSCTYCCAGDNCNGFDLNPDGNSANAGACPVNPSQLLRW